MARQLPLVLAVALASACAEHSAGTSPWDGTWSVSGSQVTSCPTGGDSQSKLSGAAVITTDGDMQTIEIAVGSCSLTWDIDEAVASLTAGQTCKVDVAGDSVAVTWSGGMLTLGDGIVGNILGRTSTVCSLTQETTFSK
nr:hypothetical protein [Kofleriaceae bacterium]